MITDENDENPLSYEEFVNEFYPEFYQKLIVKEVKMDYFLFENCPVSKFLTKERAYEQIGIVRFSGKILVDDRHFYYLDTINKEFEWIYSQKNHFKDEFIFIGISKLFMWAHRNVKPIPEYELVMSTNNGKLSIQAMLLVKNNYDIKENIITIKKESDYYVIEAK